MVRLCLQQIVCARLALGRLGEYKRRMVPPQKLHQLSFFAAMRHFVVGCSRSVLIFQIAKWDELIMMREWILAMAFVSCGLALTTEMAGQEPIPDRFQDTAAAFLGAHCFSARCCASASDHGPWLLLQMLHLLQALMPVD